LLPDYLLGEVTQPSKNQLSKTSTWLAKRRNIFNLSAGFFRTALTTCSIGVIPVDTTGTHHYYITLSTHPTTATDRGLISPLLLQQN